MGAITFKFTQMPHQQKAIQAAVDLFKGQKGGSFNFEGAQGKGQLSLFPGQDNVVHLSDEQLLQNTQKIQHRHGLKLSQSLPSRNFSIEMETGTGKTYVYIKSILELNKQYGFKKFIIVVPSLAIRAGVIKSFQVLKDHLGLQYANLPEPIVYNSKRLSRVRAFKNSADLQIMIMNIQTFQKDTLKSSNVIHRDDDQMGGRPIEFIQATAPIVIIDEPQSVDSTEKSHRALQSLKPAVVLRYSATHKHQHTLLYQLGPVQAYNQGLVKSIEVASVGVAGDKSQAYVEYLKGDNKNKIKAYVKFYKKTNSGDKLTKAWLKQNDNLYDKSKQHPAYKKGFGVKNIDVSPLTGFIEWSSGQRLSLGYSLQPRCQEVAEAMLRETIEQHFQKEMALKKQGIKVLSLFFIDRVSDYRQYLEGGAYQLGPLAQKFEQIYTQVAQKYKSLQPFKASQVHEAYFSKDKKGMYKDSQGVAQDDASTFERIMQEKEKLLDPAEPLRFIFSHTALKEGWDNPNVFQLCTLRSVGSQMQRRQQIGRGLRLAVNTSGLRVEDPQVNRLTVISGEDYSSYAAGLQMEYEQECGLKFKNSIPVVNAKDRASLKLDAQSYLNKDFKNLWDKIKTRTRYKAFFTSCAQQLAEDLAQMPPVQSMQVSVSKAKLSLNEQGVQAAASSTAQTTEVLKAQVFPNPIEALSKALPLTRATVAEALLQSQRLDDFIKNPYDFIDKALNTIEKFIARHHLTAPSLQAKNHKGG